jgi:murein DD-endopeptidase MepM/ murein hydrolase activator NlpD
VKKVANEIGIPAKNIAAIMKIESGGKQNATSPAGAMGLMQIMPFHFSGGEDPYDPYTNIKRGAEILAKNLSSYGSWDKAAAAYFGAIDASGNITGAQDVLGTGGYKYVQMFNDALSQQPAGGGYNENYTFPVEHYAGEIEPHWGELKAKGGTDIFAPEGTPVMSMVRGTIEDAGYSDIGGNYVTLRGDDGQAYYYAHMKDRPAVGMGQTVGPGTTLGQVGATGNAVGTPPHLHIGIGSDIEEGVGAFGGLGTDFDALTFLRSLLG